MKCYGKLEKQKLVTKRKGYLFIVPEAQILSDSLSETFGVSIMRKKIVYSD
jgi:hypothetical protein